MTATTQPIQITPDWLVAQLQDIISDAPEYVRKGAARLLDSFTADIAAAAGPDAQAETVSDEEHPEEEDEPH